MSQSVESGVLRVERVSEAHTIQASLSDAVIPSVPGEFYGYLTRFTRGQPVYALMKCKANKRRPLMELRALGREADLLFLWEGDSVVRVCSVAEAQRLGLLGSLVRDTTFNEAQIGLAQITAGEFDDIRSRQDVQRLVEISRASCSGRTSVEVHPGSVVAVRTTGGKHGLFLAREISRTSLLVDACHILL